MTEVKSGTEHASARAEAIKAVVVNVTRLINDAQILLANGSPGSSLSLAILAFEEAGKGHVIELALKKPKAMVSNHEFRHFVALMVLAASLTQKYHIDMTVGAANIHRHLVNATPRSRGRPVLPPMTDALRDDLRAEFIPQLQKMTTKQIENFGIESRWLQKIALVVNNGGLETLRQSGLYLDTNEDFSIASSPMSIDPIEADRWVWAAGTVLNLLERGSYRQPYSPLSELIAAAADEDETAMETLLEIAKSFAQPESV